ncbi:hypothetical protein [Cellulomonas sp. URHE0023]|uniref:hypothetical protein n=1 Tax=Cellulomonas sp. URHE0023 TaxID=1380354 RepID=UPI000488B1E7|nr:hypothetical protein [Cellulomonas sp. URHE0023]
MGFAGGDPHQLEVVGKGLGALSSDLAGDATQIARQGKLAGAAAGDGHVADLAESALAAIGGVVVAAATVVQGLAEGSTTAGAQLLQATGAVPR